MYLKIVATLFFVMLSLPLCAADRYFVGTGNWSATANWSTTSGGATGASVPVATDFVYFDGNSGNCAINANASCLGINSTGYTNTITQGAFTLTVGASNLNWVAGTFTGSASNITVNGAFVQSGGIFTSTSGTFTAAGSFTLSAGAFNPNNGTVSFTAAATITSGVFHNLTLSINGIITITNNAIVNNTFTVATLLTLNGSAIEARGNIVFTDTSWNGSSKIIVNGTSTQTFTGAGVCGVTMDVDKASGAVNLGANRAFLNATSDLNLIAGTFNCVTFTLAVTGKFTQTGGIFLGGTGAITITGIFTLDSGTFTSTTGVLTLASSISIASGVFSHNNGTVTLTAAAVTIVDGNFYNLTLNGATQIATITNNTIVANSLTFSALVTLNGSPIEARGNIVFTDTSWNGSSKLIVNGTGTQTFTGAGVCGVTMDVDKASGLVSLGANMTFLGTTSDLNLIAGDFNCNTRTLTLTRNMIITGGVFNYGTGTVIYTGAAVTITSGNFYNLTLNVSTQVATITNNAIVANTLTFSALATLNGSPIEARGNIVFTDTSWNGSSKLIVNGTGTQTITGAGKCGVTMDVDKASGLVSLGANMTFLGTTSDLNLIAGDFNCNTRTLTLTRNMIITGGVFNYGTGTVIYTGAAVTITSGNFYNLTLNVSTQVATITNNAIVANTLTFSALATLNGSPIEARGNIVFSDTSWNGSSKIIVNGTGTQTITGAGKCGVTMDVDKASGLVSLGANLTFLGTTRDLNLIAGDFNCNTRTLTITRNLVITSGVFNAGTGTVVFTGAAVNIVSGNFYNLTLNASAQVATITNNTIVNNTLNLAAVATVNGSPIEARGNIVFTDTSRSGSSVLIANGAGDQNISGTGEVNLFEINKPSGNLIFNSSVSINVGSWTHTLGNIIWNSNTVTCNGGSASILSGDFYNLTLNNTSLILTLTNNIVVANTLTLTSIATLNGSNIEAKGDIVFTDTSFTGTGTIIANGTVDQNISGVGDVNNFEINKASGNLIFNSSVAINGGGWTHTAGSIVWNNNTVTCNGSPVVLVSGNFFNLTFNLAALVVTATNNSIVNNTLTVTAITTLNGDTIEAKGDIVFTDVAYSGTGTISANGTSDQNISGVGDANNFVINKASGDLIFNSSVAINGGVWTHTAGNIVWNNNTVTCNATTATISNGRFYQLILNNSSLVLTLVGNTIVTNTLTLSALITVNGGSVSAEGDIVNTDVSWNGTGSLIASGTVDQNIMGVGDLGKFEINKISGNLNFNTGVVISQSWKYIAGNIVWNNNTVTFNGLTSSIDNGEFYNVILNNTSMALTILNNPTVGNILTFTSIATMDGSTLQAKGNVVFTDTNWSGTGVLTLTGTANQDTSGAGMCGVSLDIYKPAGVITLLSNLTIGNSGNDMTIVDGDLNLNGFNLVVPDLFTVYDKLTLRGNENINVNGIANSIAITNPNFTISATSSTIEYINSAVTAVVTNLSPTFYNLTLGASKIHEFDSGVGNGITIYGTFASNGTSSTRSVLRSFGDAAIDWELNLVGSSLLEDKVSVKRSDASAGADVYAFGSLSSGNNTKWIFSDPTITSITSLTADGIYSAGTEITIQINFSHAITLVGTMGVNLDTGGFAVINGFTGSSATGSYLVGANQNTLDLTATSISVTGTARDLALNNLVLTIPGTNIADGSEIVIDTIAPTITSITSPKPNGTYSIGETINVQISFSEMITVTTSLSVSLDSGGLITISGFTGTSASGVYTVLAGENSSDLTVSSVSVTGTALDSALNNLSLTLPGTNIATSSNIVIDTLAPTMTSITSSKPNGAYSIGETIAVQVNFSEAITVSTSLNITLDTGGVVSIAGFTGTAASGTYTVLAGHSSMDLSASNVSITGTARDVALNNLVLTLPGTNISTARDIIIDTAAPTITSITSDKVDGEYSIGQTINVRINFSEIISVTTALNVNLDAGGVATIISFTGTTAVGTYTVLAGHTSADLTASSVSIVGTAQDAALNNLVLTLPLTNIATDSNIVIDTTAPTLASITSNKPNGSYAVGEVIDVRANFSEPITVTTSLSITLDTGGIVSIIGFTGTTAVGTYTVMAGHNSLDLNASSVSVIGTARDVALNDLVLTLPSTNIANGSNIIVDTTAPIITSITSNKPNGTYAEGETININVNFSELITVSTSLSVTLDTGGVVNIAGFTGTSAVGTYTVLLGHNSADLTANSVSVTGSARDSALNSLELTLPVINIATNSDIVISTLPPSITSISSSTANGTYSTGETINVILDFSTSITLNGTLTVNLDSGGSLQINSFSNATQASGTYTVLVGHASADLNVTSITVNGTAKDVALTDLVLTLPGSNLATNKNIAIDGLNPTFTNIFSDTPNGYYSVGASINVTINFSKAVTLVGTLSLSLDSGGIVEFSSFANATSAVSVYTVLAGHSSVDLNSVSATINGTCKDAFLNDLNLSMPGLTIATASDIVVDTIAPEITSTQSISPNGAYCEGQAINLIITFSESVTSTGTLSISLSSGGMVEFGTFTGTNTTGVYTVLSGHNTSELNVTAVSLLSGVILDNSANAINLAMPSTNIGPISSIQIDTIVPTFVSHALAAGNVSIDITLTEGVYSTNLGTGALDVSDFALVFASNGGAASNVVISGVSNTSGGALMGGESNVRILLSITGVVSGTETIKIDPILDSIFDKAGNVLSITNTTGTILLFDQLGPSVVNVTSIAPLGSYKAGSVIPIRIKFTENVLVIGSPQLMLETGTADRLAVYIGGSGTANLTFNYTVQSGDISADLDYTSTTALSLNGGTIRDAFSNNATLLLPAVAGAGSLGFNNSINIDTTLPKIVSGSLGPNNAYIDISFSEPVYTTAGAGGLDLSDFQVIFLANGGTATGVNISDLKSISGSSLIGGETIIRVFIALTGLPSGKETVTIKPTNSNIFDLAGNDMLISETSGVITFVDQGTVPTVQNISVLEGDGIYGVSKVLTIAVKFSEVVAVTGMPYIELETGLINRLATFDNSVNNSNTLLFKYEIQLGDMSEKLEFVGSNSFVAGNNIKSLLGIPANVTLPLPGTTGSISFNNTIKIETNKLIITSISTTAPNGIYNSDMTIPLQFNISRPVELLGGQLNITLNSGAILEVTQLNGNQINVDYVIKSSDTAKLLNVSNLSLSSGASIKDSQGINLDLSIPTVLFSTAHQIEIKNSNIELFVNATAEENGTILPAGRIAVNNGENLDFVIVANQGYFIKEVLVNGVSVGAVTNYAFTNINDNSSIHAVFSKTGGSYQILSNAGFGGGILPSGITQALDGGDLKYTFFAEPGYHISNVRVNGVSLGAMNAYTFSNIQNDNQIFVSFAKDQSSYLISSNRIGMGQIIPAGHQQIPDGGDINFQIIPEAGFHIRDVIIDGESFGRISEVPFVNVIDNHTVTAVFEKTESEYPITINTSGKGTVSPNDSLLKIPRGGFAKFIFKPQSGSHVANVIIDGVSKGSIDQYEFNDVNEIHSVEVLFQETKEFYQVVSSVKNSSANSKIIFSNNSDVTHGGALTFMVTAEAGKSIVSVKANGRFLYGENKASFKMKNHQTLGESASFVLSPVLADTIIEVEFTKIELDYLININTIGKGSSDPQGTISVKKDAAKGIIFKADEGHHLSDVLVDGISVGPIENLGLININNNKNIKAIFSKTSSEYKINSSVTGKGSINPVGENTVAANGSINFSFAPESGYQLVDIKVNNKSLITNSTNANNNSYLFTNVITNHTIDAIFSKIAESYTIATSTSVGESVSSQGSVNVAAGSNHFIQVEPVQGYHVADVLINGVSVGSSSAYLISNVMRDYTVFVLFEADELTYKISANKSKFGSVEPADLIEVNAGDNQAIEFKPISGYRVLDVKINGESKGAITSYLFKNVIKNQSVEVTYAELAKPNSIKAEVFGAGNINPEGITAVSVNDSIIYSIQEHRNGQILDVKIDGISYGAISSYTFTDVSSDHTIQVYFSDKPSADISNEESDAIKIKGTGCQFVLNASNLNVFELLLLLVLLLLLTNLIKSKKLRRF